MNEATAWVFTDPKKKLECKEFPLPKLEDSEILVKNTCCTICKSDLHTASGNRPGPMPSILGHEIVGEVVELPKTPIYDYNNQELKTGDLITWTLMASCGTCALCQKGYPQKCQQLRKYGNEATEGHFLLTGGFATHTHLYPGTTIFKLPHGFDLRYLASLNCSWATVAACIRTAGTIARKNVVIFGAGMLGILAAMMCKESGASNIIIVEKDESRLNLAQQFGADKLIPINNNTSISESINDSLDDQVDIILEVSGSNNAIKEALNIAGIGCSIVLAGSVIPVDDIRVNPEKIVRGLINIHGVHNYIPEDLAWAIRFFESFAQKYPLEELFEAHEFTLPNTIEAINYASSSTKHRVSIRT